MQGGWWRSELVSSYLLLMHPDWPSSGFWEVQFFPESGTVEPVDLGLETCDLYTHAYLPVAVRRPLTHRGQNISSSDGFST